MIIIKRRISFAIDKPTGVGHAVKADTTRVRCVVTWNSQRVRLSCGVAVNPRWWEASVQRCRAKSFHGINKTPASVINRKLDEMEEAVNSIFMRFEEADQVPSKTDFLEAYLQIDNPNSQAESKNDKPIFPIFDLFIQEGTALGRWRESTLKKIRCVYHHLRKISPTMTFQDLEQKGMVKIIKHLSKLPDKENNKGLRNSTINKVISVTKSFVRWAIQNNYCSNNKFVTQRQLLKSSKRTVVYLEWPELMRVYNYDFSKNTRLGQARDVFCFCCFTSLRYSDVFNLRRSDIIGDSLHLTTIKTSTAIVIELNKYSKAILEKYSKCEFPDDKALPVISNQRMNDYIKEIGCICQINTPIKITSYKGTARIDETFPKWELLSSHAGRRTFICNALILGIPRDIVMKWTGHSDYKAMEPYIEIADKAKRNAMALFDGIN